MQKHNARLEAAKMGVDGEIAQWLDINLRPQLDGQDLTHHLGAFPPQELMSNTSGLQRNQDFAAHGVAILEALSACSPKPVREFRDLLDFGVGVGRLARMFKGFTGRYVGVDVDARHIEWVGQALDYVEAFHTTPRKPLPFGASAFDAVVSISVFTHMNEADQLFYLEELRRVTAPGACLFLTVHGERALARAVEETRIFEMLDVPSYRLQEARESFEAGDGFTFIIQNGHLTSEAYDYGITFISKGYVEKVWSRHFEVVAVASGMIHDFQDIVVLRRRG